MIVLKEGQNSPAYGRIKYDNGSETVQGFKSYLAAVRWFNKTQKTVSNYTELEIARKENCI